MVGGPALKQLPVLGEGALGLVRTGGGTVGADALCRGRRDLVTANFSKFLGHRRPSMDFVAVTSITVTLVLHPASASNPPNHDFALNEAGGPLQRVDPVRRVLDRVKGRSALRIR